MADVPEMITGLADYTVADLEALERERPELGRLEVIDGAAPCTTPARHGRAAQNMPH